MKRLCKFFGPVLTFTAAGLLLAQMIHLWVLGSSTLQNRSLIRVRRRRVRRERGMPPGVSIEGVNAAGKPMAYGYTIIDDGKRPSHDGGHPNGHRPSPTKRMSANKVRSKFHEGWQACRTATSRSRRTAKS